MFVGGAPWVDVPAGGDARVDWLMAVVALAGAGVVYLVARQSLRKAERPRAERPEERFPKAA